MPAFKQPLISPEEITDSTKPMEHDWRRTDNVDVEGLKAELCRTVEGEVRFDRGSKSMYAVDASNYRQVPIGVVIPKSKEDVVHAVSAACRKFGAPVLSRGGGTSLAGQCCNVAVVIDWTKYLHGVLEINAQETMGEGPAWNHLRRIAPSCDAGNAQSP